MKYIIFFITLTAIFSFSYFLFSNQSFAQSCLPIHLVICPATNDSFSGTRFQGSCVDNGYGGSTCDGELVPVDSFFCLASGCCGGEWVSCTLSDSVCLSTGYRENEGCSISNQNYRAFCRTGDCAGGPDPPPPYSTHTIIVETVGNGSGLVTAPRANQSGSNPSQSGINCHSSGSPNNCSDERESRSSSTTWNLTASADAGSEFVGWNIPAHSMGTQCGENSSCRVRVTGSQTTVRARFQVSATGPTLSCQVVSENQINLSWTSVPPTAGGTTEYTVFRCTGAGCNPSVGVHTTTGTGWGNTGRVADTTYGYLVGARPAPGVALPSNTVYCTTLPPDHINDDINDDPNDAPPPPPPPCVCSWGNCVTSGPCVGTGCGWTGTRTGTETYICTSGVNCPGEGNTRSCSVSCNLGPCPEIDNFWVEPSSWVKRGEERTINWETSNVTSCTLRREPPTPPASFSVGSTGPYLTGPMEFVTKFTLTCSRLNNYGVEVTTDPETLFIRILPVFKEV